MKLQYLGTAAAEGIPALFCECEACNRSRILGGRNLRSRSQAIVDDKILIDFPADTYMHFMQYNVPLAHVRTCLVTHSHSDHLYPADIQMRMNGCFAHVNQEQGPLAFYSDQSSYDMIRQVVEQYQIPESDVSNTLIMVNQSFEVEDYTITGIRASHDPITTPVVYLIEKEDKSILYSNDTGEYPKESWEFLRKRKVPLSLVSLDCTSANSVSDYYGHFDFRRCRKMKEQMLKENIADINTLFILNHFSHNAADVVYDDFVKIAMKYGFDVSYDGMIVEV